MSKKSDKDNKKKNKAEKKEKTKLGTSAKMATQVFSGNSERATKMAITSQQEMLAIAKAEAEERDKRDAADRKIALKNFKQAHPYMQNRELSWLEFNRRVLDQGADATVPLFERLSFISIFWSNLQEFFMVRVGSLTDLSLVKKTITDSKSGMTPSEQLNAIYERCHELYPYYEECYSNLSELLANEGIKNIASKDLTPEQLDYLEDYFAINVMPFLSPQIINARHPFPHLENGALYVIVRLNEHAQEHKIIKEAIERAIAEDRLDKEELESMFGSNGKSGDKQRKGSKKKKGSKNLGAQGVTLGLIPLPRQCSRIIKLPETLQNTTDNAQDASLNNQVQNAQQANGEFKYILLEQLIEMFADRVFSMYKVKHTNVICVTRNADLDANEGMEEQGEDYREHMKRILKKRARLAPVRLECERELSETVKNMLLARLNLKNHQVFTTSVPLDMSFVYDLPKYVAPPKRAALEAVPFSPQWPAQLDRRQRILDQVAEKEVLLTYPYQSMDAFVQLLREASVDPSVVSIKITLYRLAKQSHLAEALIAAAEMGKEVTALFELRARFDESNNIEWSQRFEQAGCNVIYGFRDFKVHSKICCITRQTPEGVQYITQLGTGNYNEKTARLYTDFSFITTDPAIGIDAMQFFRNMQLENTSDEYDTLWVAPLQIKRNILLGIDDQIAKHKAGLPSGLYFKTNSITDKDVIDKIVEASQAGVPCMLFVRGISCIVPGVAGYTENVRVTSIVGRLLEHSRIYSFGPLSGNPEDGIPTIYLSSADLMTRNMDKRIEIAWPINNQGILNQILGYIATCMADTAKLRELMPDGKYTPLGYFAQPSGISGDVELFDSQSYLIGEAARSQFVNMEETTAAYMPNVEAVRQVELADIESQKLYVHDAEPTRSTDLGTAEVVADGAAAAVPEVVADVTETADLSTEEVVDAAPEAEVVDAATVATDVTDTVDAVTDATTQADVDIPETIIAETASETIATPVASSAIDSASSIVDDLAANIPFANAQTQIEEATEAISADTIPVDLQAESATITMPASETSTNIDLPTDLPMIAGAGKFDIVPDDQASDDMDKLVLPNLEKQTEMQIAIENSEYTDPSTNPEPLDIPKEKQSFWKRHFG